MIWKGGTTMSPITCEDAQAVPPGRTVRSAGPGDAPTYYTEWQLPGQGESPDSCGGRPPARRDEDLLALLRREREAQAAACRAGDAARAGRHGDRVRELEGELWRRLERGLVRPLARSFRAWVRGAGLDSDDLVQLAFLRLEECLRPYDPARGVPLRCWLRTLLSRYFIALGRRRGPRAPGAGPGGVCAGSPDREALRLGVREVLAAILPADCRRERKVSVFWRYWVEGYTMAELAALEGVAASTVARWLLQVRAAFVTAWVRPRRHQPDVRTGQVA
jgi:DNA-directed RNA polymerase specialized sigma24 family protein